MLAPESSAKLCLTLPIKCVKIVVYDSRSRIVL